MGSKKKPTKQVKKQVKKQAKKTAAKTIVKKVAKKAAKKAVKKMPTAVQRADAALSERVPAMPPIDPKIAWTEDMVDSYPEMVRQHVSEVAVSEALVKARADFDAEIESFSKEMHAALGTPEERDIVEHAREVREERDRLRAESLSGEQQNWKRPIADGDIQAIRIEAQAFQQQAKDLRHERDVLAEALGAPKSVFDLAAYTQKVAEGWKNKLAETHAFLDEVKAKNIALTAQGAALAARVEALTNTHASDEAFVTAFRMMYAVDFSFDNLPDDHKVFVEAVAEVIESEVRAEARTTA